MLASGAEFEVTTVDPEHNRLASARRRCIDIQVQAVLTFTGITTSAIYSNCEVASRCGIWRPKSVLGYESILCAEDDVLHVLHIMFRSCNRNIGEQG